MNCQKDKNLENCSCTYPNCVRKGKCCDCLSYHLRSEELPACCFSEKEEKKYDRSIGNFVKDRLKNK